MLASVIIPTYNRADKLVRAINSAINQTYPHKQIIVVDDGSTDNTRDVVKKFPEIKYFYQRNKRQAAARNSGLKLAKGKYVTTLDSDDIWNEGFLTKSIECLKKHDLDFVFSSWTALKDGGYFPSAWEISKAWNQYVNNPQDDWFLLSPAQVRQLFIEICPAPSSSLVIRKDSIVSEWNSDLIIADDWCFILDMVIKKQCRAGFTLQRLWQKSVHSDNIYDGRNRGEIAKELEVHDTRLMRNRHLSKLSFNEKMTLNKRIIKGHIVQALFFARDNFGIRNPQRLWRSNLELKNEIKPVK